MVWIYTRDILLKAQFLLEMILPYNCSSLINLACIVIDSHYFKFSAVLIVNKR